MSSPSIYQQLVPTSQVEVAIVNTLDLWIGSSLAEVERQVDIPGGACTVARPRSYQSSYDFQNWPEGQLPALVVVCNGTADDVEQNGPQYGAWFEAEVGCLVEDTTEANARRVAHYYQAAIEASLLGHGSLGGFANTTTLIKRTTQLPDVENRTLAIAPSTFHVYVDSIVTAYAGPRTPPPDPCAAPEPWPTVTETNVTFDVEPPSGS